MNGDFTVAFAETIASAMLFLSKNNYPKNIIESEEIKEIVSKT